MLVNEALMRLEECSLIDELQDVWQTHWSSWRAEYNPLDLRRIVAKKDEVKLRLAREVLTRNAGDPDILPVILSTVRAMLGDSPSLPPAWDFLAQSGWTDAEVTSTEEALFLYALELIRTIDPSALVEMWEAYGPWWKRRMPVAAYAIVRDRLYERLKPLNLKAFQEGRYGRF